VDETPAGCLFDLARIKMHEEDFNYHAGHGYVYTTELALEIAAIWEGVDRLEYRGVSLDTIGRALNRDWETSVIALAQLGRKRP
jgi:hypothetical protein